MSLTEHCMLHCVDTVSERNVNMLAFLLSVPSFNPRVTRRTRKYLPLLALSLCTTVSVSRVENMLEWRKMCRYERSKSDAALCSLTANMLYLLWNSNLDLVWVKSDLSLVTYEMFREQKRQGWLFSGCCGELKHHQAKSAQINWCLHIMVVKCG